MNLTKEYDNFVFYGSFAESVNAIYGVSEEKGNKLLKAIMDYGTMGVVDNDDPIIYAILASIVPNIDAAKTKYAKGIKGGDKGGAPRRIDYDKVYEMHDGGHSNADISAELDCSQKQVRAILNKRIKMELIGGKEPNPDIDIERDNNIYKEFEKDSYIEREYEKHNNTDGESNNNDEWELDGYNTNGTPYYKCKDPYGQDDDGILLYHYKNREGYDDDDEGLPF